MTTDYGRRLLIQVVGERSQSGFSQSYASLPISTNPQDGFREVSYKLLHKAIDRCTWFLVNHIHSDIFAWLSSPTDFRYILLAFACMKTGHRVFFPSIRNNLDAQLSLLKVLNYDTLLKPQTRLPLVQHILDKHCLHTIELPTLSQLLWEENEVPPYPFQKSFDEARFQPCVFLHTSGSTGTPKPITIKHGWFSIVDAFSSLSIMSMQPHGLSLFKSLRVFVPFPNFHAAGMITNLAVAVFFEVTNVYAPEVPLSVELVDSYHQHAGIQATFLPASILKGLAEEPGYAKTLSSLKLVHYGGSALARDIGEGLRHHVYLTSHFGITEVSRPYQPRQKEC